MQKNLLIGIVAAVAVALTAASWMFIPSLQSAQRTVNANAAIQLERARRLFNEYDPGVNFQSLLVARFEEEGLTVDAGDLSESVADEYEAIHSELWESYPPHEWRGDRPSRARANYGNIAGQIRDGLVARDRGAVENDRLLDEALRAVNGAMALSAGQASSRSYAEAGRLKGAILYHKGLTNAVNAGLYRLEAEPYLGEVLTAARQSVESKRAQTLVSESEIDDRIGELEHKAEELRVRTQADREELASLEGMIRELEARLEAAKTRREHAMHALGKLRIEGIDFSDPRGAETFQARVEQLDKAYRAGIREAHALEAGDYADARIDNTGDYLEGHYVDPQGGRAPMVTFGLRHYRDKRAVLAGKVDGQQAALDALREGMARLDGMRASLASRARDIVRRANAAAAAAADAFAELNRLESEAHAIEDDALDLFDQSINACEKASRDAQSWVRDASRHTDGLAPDARDRSPFAPRLRDKWMGGHMLAQASDARLAKAWIFYDRYRAYSRNADALSGAGDTITIEGVDVAAEQAKADEARTAGIEEVTAAMESLEQAHRDADKHWTITAQGAGTMYLLVLFGQEDYVADAIDAYREALKGREDESFTSTFAARLARLENR